MKNLRLFLPQSCVPQQLRRVPEIIGPPSPQKTASVMSRAVRSQSTKPPNAFDVFSQSLVCVDYDVGTGGDDLWKRRTLEDIYCTGWI